MLNYKRLRSQSKEKIQSFSREQLKNWIAFDQNRDNIDRLLSGESVSIKYAIVSLSIISDIKEQIEVGDNCSYAMAA